jgi:Flp pilus assembly pilin Flp
VKRLVVVLNRLVQREDGVSIAEYALLTALLVVLALAGIRLLGSKISQFLTETAARF